MTMQAGSLLGFDSSGNPTLQLGDATSTHQNASIRCMPVGTWAKDIIGNTQQVYANHVIQLSTEQNATTTTTGSMLTAGNLMGCLAACLRTGCRVELWISAAAVTTASDVTGANAFGMFDATFVLLMAWEPSVQYPLIGSM